MMAQETENESIARLVAQRDRLKAEVEKLSALADDTRDRFEAAKPEKPEEIFVKGFVDQVMLDSSWFRPPTQYALRNGLRQSVTAEGWRAMLANPPRLAGSGEICKRTVERIRVGLAAAERYEEAVRRVDLETSYSAADDAYEAARDRLWELDERILALKAQSLNDVVLQAAVVEQHSSDDGEVSAEFVNCLLSSIKALGAQATA